jgi:hypothetical protein
MPVLADAVHIIQQSVVLLTAACFSLPGECTSCGGTSCYAARTAAAATTRQQGKRTATTVQCRVNRVL